MRAVRRVHSAGLVLWGTAADQNGIVRMGLDMFLEILRALKRLAAEIALVRLERDVNTNVGGDVVALDRRGAALVPLAGQVQVVGALPTDVFLANVLLKRPSQTCPN